MQQNILDNYQRSSKETVLIGQAAPVCIIMIFCLLGCGKPVHNGYGIILVRRKMYPDFFGCHDPDAA